MKQPFPARFSLVLGKMNSPNSADPNRLPWLRLTWLILAGLSVVFFCGLVTSLEVYTGLRVVSEVVMWLVMGLMLGAIFSAAPLTLLTRSWVSGFALTLSVGLLGSWSWQAAWLAGEQIQFLYNDYSITYVEFEGPFVVASSCVIPLLSFGLTAPLIFARSRGWQLVPKNAVVKPAKGSLEDIFVAMTIVASLLALARVSMQVTDAPASTFWSSILFATLALSVVGAPMLWIVLVVGTRANYQEMQVATYVFFTCLAFTMGAVACVVVFAIASGPNAGDQVFLPAVMTAIAATVVMTLALYGLRAIGLRIVPFKKTTMPTAGDSSLADAAASSGESPADATGPAVPTDSVQEASTSATTSEPQVDSPWDGESAAEVQEPRTQSRICAAAIVLICCVASGIGGSVKTSRDQAINRLRTLAIEKASSGAAVAMYGGEIQALRVADGMTEEEIRTLLSPRITDLSLANSKVSDDFMAEIAGLELMSLDLSGTGITAAGLAQLRSETYLSYLGLGNTKITAAEISEFLTRNPVGVLDLTGMEFGDAELTKILPVVGRGFVLTGNDVSEQWLRDSLAQSGYIDLTGVPIKGEFLAELPDVEALILDSTKVTDAELATIPSTTSIGHLSIRNTAVTLAGIKPLLPRVGELTIGDGPLSESDISTICRNSSKLRIDRSDFVGHKLLSSPWQLELLDVSGTQFDDQAVQDLVTSGVDISILNLADTNVTGACLANVNRLQVYEVDVSNTAVDAHSLMQDADFGMTVHVAHGQFTDEELQRLKAQAGPIMQGKRWRDERNY